MFMKYRVRQKFKAIAKNGLVDEGEIYITKLQIGEKNYFRM